MPHHHARIPGPPEALPMAPRTSTHMPASPSALPPDAGRYASSSSSWVIKPGCMMELARLAKIPQPESGLMCPRCQSTETKFCYYNNYSLSQPRHLCRTCRRYWTHGGALRDLPFSTTLRRRRRRGKPSSSNTKHDASSSKVAIRASGTTGRASSSSSSSSTGAAVPGGGVAMAAAMMQQDPVLPLVYRHQHQYLWQQRQPLSFLAGYKSGVISSVATTSAICPFVVSEEAGGTEVGSFAGEMQAMSGRRVPGLPAAVTMAAENTPLLIPSGTEMMMGALASSPSPGVGLQGDTDVFRLLGSGGSSWACGYGFTAGNGSVVGGGRNCTVITPGNLWPGPSGFTSSSSSGWT